MLLTDFPIVEDVYQLTPNWSLTLPGQFKRRIEDGDLVLWNPDLTLWIAVWNNDQGQSKEARLASIKKLMSADAFDLTSSTSAGILRFSYRLQEAEPEPASANEDAEPVAAFYCFALGDSGQVEIAIYLDKEDDISQAQAILQSLTETPAS